MKIMAIIMTALMLASCAPPTILVQDRYTVVTPPDSFYNCPQLTSLPDPATLTDLEVARVLVKLDRYNKTCGASIQTLKQFYLNARKRFPG